MTAFIRLAFFYSYGTLSLDANHLEKYYVHGPRCFLQELPGHVHFCTGGYGEDSSRLRNFEGFKLVTNLKKTKEVKCNLTYNTYGLRTHAKFVRPKWRVNYLLQITSLTASTNYEKRKKQLKINKEKK